MDSDEEARDDGLFLRAIGDNTEIRETSWRRSWRSWTPRPSRTWANRLGRGGSLETLVRNHGADLSEEIERLARQNFRFRRALRSVWAYDSPEYDRRTQLLEELGGLQRLAHDVLRTQRPTPQQAQGLGPDRSRRLPSQPGPEHDRQGHRALALSRGQRALLHSCYDSAMAPAAPVAAAEVGPQAEPERDPFGRGF